MFDNEQSIMTNGKFVMLMILLIIVLYVFDALCDIFNWPKSWMYQQMFNYLSTICLISIGYVFGHNN